MTTAHPARRPRAPRTRQPKKIRAPKQSLTPVELALQLDLKESKARLKLKEAAAKKEWGKDWRSYVRRGRAFSRVVYIDATFADAEGAYVLRPEPGWEWNCSNCGTYSFVPASMIAEWKTSINGKLEHFTINMLAEWEVLAEKTKANGFKPPAKPTPEMCGCPNCKFRPGAPE